jgi:hypothetical protein
MTIKITHTAEVASTSTSYSLSQLISVGGTTGNPEYLVVTALDRNEYTVSASGQTGFFSGNGHELALSSIGGDGRAAGIIFTWNPTTDSYVNSTYGSLSQLTFTSSSSPYDITNLSVFTASSASVVNGNAFDPYNMVAFDPSGYLGSVTFSTAPNFSGTLPTQPTPEEVAAIAQTFVGDAWNDEGCWVLASTIAAEAGTSLPITSTEIDVAGKASGEWVVVYNGPAGATGNWQALVSTGDVVVFGTPGGGGHVTTCVSGQGASAMLIDNITYGSNWGISNLANDGSPNDVIVEAAHPAYQEWAGVSSSSVVIYALDTPAVTDKSATETLTTGKASSISSWFSVSDPADKSITAYQIYDSGGGTIVVGGRATDAISKLTDLTLATLSNVSLEDMTTGSSTLDIRAYNGTYWGDWQTLTVTATSSAATTHTTTTGDFLTFGSDHAAVPHGFV